MVEDRREYFTVNVHGQYFAETGERKELRAYRATFRLPDARAPLGVIKGKLLIPFLKSRDPQAYNVYTHFIDEIIPPGGKPFDPDEIPTRFQTKEQLKVFIQRHHLPIEVEDYGNLGLLRDHVRIAKEEPENFLIISQKHMKKQAEDKALADLNAEFAQGEAGISIPVSEGGGVVDASTPGEKVNKPVKAAKKTSTKDFLS